MSHVKYPRTMHFPWSPGIGSDDKVARDLTRLEASPDVVATVKMDGENTTFYRDGLHARSLDYTPHASRTWCRRLHAKIAHEIPDGWRICGENLYAMHSIRYRHLPDYFLVYSIWDESNVCLPWDETVEWAALLSLQTVPVLYRGLYDEEIFRTLYRPEFEGDPCEGFVVRMAGAFAYADFSVSVAKYVRANHVSVSDHWMHQTVIPNEIAHWAWKSERH